MLQGRRPKVPAHASSFLQSVRAQVGLFITEEVPVGKGNVAEKSNGAPWYLESPQCSTLWLHPIITKWVRHANPPKVELGYCQVGTEWKKATHVATTAL